MDNVPIPAAPVTLFYSYAHEDEALRDELQGHLKLLERRGLLAPWHDRQIVAGEEWAGRINENLRRAELVLLLVSKDFIKSDYIMGTELAVAMQRQAEHAAVVVPIVVRALDLDPEDAQDLPFLKLQALPTDLRPVTSWPNRDEAWTNVAKGLRATVKIIRERRPPALPVPPISAPGSIDTKTMPIHTHDEMPSMAAPVDWRSAGSVKLERFESVPQKEVPATRVDRPATDPLLDRVVADVAQQIVQAQRERSAIALDAQGVVSLQAQTRTLIDLPDQQRVLWVDNHPEGNRFEAAALAKLQIEVVTARSTDEALHIIAADREGFALVISDWDRAGEPAPAGLHLLARLRHVGIYWPLVFYHAADRAQRPRRAAQACAAGALGEAVLPSELMALVVQALQADSTQQEPGDRFARYDYISALRVPGGDPKTPWIAYTLRSKRARSEVCAKHAQGTLLSELVAKASYDANTDPDIGRTLFNLLIPMEMEPFLGGTSEMVIELEPQTAGIPWELLNTNPDVHSDDKRPWAIRSKLIRKLQLEEFRAQLVDASAEDNVLVIGEPKCDSKLYPPLPGARREAIAVAQQLTAPGSGIAAGKVIQLVDQNDAQTIINELFKRPYRVVHVAGHGEFGANGGVVLSGDNTYLGANEVNAMRTVPELVFLNCCHLPSHDAALLLKPYDRAGFAANIAEALIRVGVRCVIAAGWAVEDDAAEKFATSFYASLLGGARFIEAVGVARTAAWNANRQGNTWAAYQCYGDPEWSWRREGADAAARLFP
ncbi:MAG: CHAT domain-containing protein [Comamonadaceae bacterium]|nr:CHAT domain-containing protein [Comamonadaceae bacterium]